MKTPYDAALRVQQREIDEMSAAIGAQSNALHMVEQQGEHIINAMRQEADVAGADLTMPYHAYFQRMRLERERLRSCQHDMKKRLDELRDKAVDAYGSFKAIETAASGYRQDAERMLANIAQASMDDFAAVSFLKTRKAGKPA